MHRRALLVPLWAAVATAFRDTAPLVAFASSDHDCGTPFIIHAPGLRSTDLARLAAHSAIRSAWDRADGGRLHVPYVQAGQHPVDVTMPSMACTLHREFRLERADGFEAEGEDRVAAMDRLDALVDDRVRTVDGSHLVIITSHPDAHALHKRQLVGSRPSLTILQSSGGSNSTFKPAASAPALAKYTIVTPIQIITLLIFLLVLVPAVLLTIGWLSEIEIPTGLTSGKMKGDQVDQKRKDQ